ncbi:ABC transporter ATP-binding protein [Candidatus Woesearchaeota archaeon]|nr:ABC transporter ATP-binding protein [Candidatus Woesearchaeota archaeon]
MRPLLEFRNVWKTYQLGETQVNALAGVSLKVPKGEFMAILGPSGSGKSTMAHLMGCLDLPSKGHIFLDGHDISSLSESALAQIRGRKIGFVFQQFNLLQTLSAVQNVMLPLVFQGVPEAKRRQTAETLLKQVGLGNRTDHRPGQLSGGEQQRVAIARALAPSPEMILADEPTGNLDSKTGAEIMDALVDLHEVHGNTIVMVTHDVNLVRHTDRVIHLRDGTIEKEVQNHQRK